MTMKQRATEDFVSIWPERSLGSFMNSRVAPKAPSHETELQNSFQVARGFWCGSVHLFVMSPNFRFRRHLRQEKVTTKPEVHGIAIEGLCPWPGRDYKIFLIRDIELLSRRWISASFRIDIDLLHPERFIFDGLLQPNLQLVESNASYD